MTPAERFQRHVSPEPMSGCWLWTGCAGKRPGHEYGKVKVDGRVMGAHIRAFNLYRGTVPEGLELDHLCRVTICVNPDHLEPVTHRVNVLRGASVQAAYARRTQCPLGHALDGANLILDWSEGRKSRYRRCRTCTRGVQRLAHRAKKAAGWSRTYKSYHKRSAE